MSSIFKLSAFITDRRSYPHMICHWPQILKSQDGPLEKLWGWGGGGESSRRNFFPLSNSLYEFFRPLHEYFLGLIGVHEIFFHLIFQLREYFLLRPKPPPPFPLPHKFSNGLSLTDSRLYPHMICHWPQICHNGSRKLIWSHHRCPKLTLRVCYFKRGRGLVMNVFSQESRCRIKRSEVC